MDNINKASEGVVSAVKTATTASLPLKKSATQPWKPASFLKVNEKYCRPGYRVRWIRKDNLEKAEAEGWNPIKEVQKKVAPEKTIIDGTQLDGTVQKRTLILCEISEEEAKARTEFFAKLTDESLHSSTEKFKKETSDEVHGSRAYGEVKINVGKGE